jgi:hypothetical protein
MDNNRNWPGWAALALAGLALIVALSGRFDFRVQVPTEPERVVVVTAPPAVLPTVVPPAAGSEWRQEMDAWRAEMKAWQEELHRELGAVPAPPIPPNLELQPPVPPQPAAGRYRGWFSEGHFVPAFGAPWRWIPNLLQLLGLAALLWLLFRAIRPRGPRSVRTRDTGPLAGSGE